MTELLVVILIIAVLATIIFTSTQKMRGNALNTRCVSNLRQLGIGMGSWMGEYGTFPAPKADGDGDGQADSCREWNFQGIGDVQGTPSLFRTLYSVEAIKFRYGDAPPNSTMYHLKDTVFVCPATEAKLGPVTSSGSYASRGYGMNSAGNPMDWTKPINPVNLVNASQTFLLIDSAAVCTDIYFININETNPRSFKSVSSRHNGHLNVLYCDFHVAAIDPGKIPKDVRDPFWAWGKR